jgi:UPF0271 protein
MDLNADLGERADTVASGLDERFMAIVTSVNVACGGHAGDRATIEATVRAARRLEVAIGAHPGYADPARFGRVDLDLPPGEIADSVYHQVQELAAVCAALGTTLGHVKPHGALYSRAARDEGVARAIADGVLRVSKDLVLVGLAGSAMLDAFRRAGFAVASEAFADRRYEADGTLRPRSRDGALIVDPAEAAAQAVSIARGHRVVAGNGSVVPIEAQTICVHSDTPGGLEIARAVRAALDGEGVPVRAFSLSRRGAARRTRRRWLG